jgi:hypothetical protein
MWFLAMLRQQLRAPAVQLLTVPEHAEFLGKILEYCCIPAAWPVVTLSAAQVLRIHQKAFSALLRWLRRLEGR